MTKQPLIIVGTSAFAQVAYEYFSYDSEYDVVAFSVESEYLKEREMNGLPVVPWEKITDLYSPQTYYVYVAIVYTSLNRLRTRLFYDAKAKGYKIASYISSKAFVWRNVEIGEHCFIFENNVLQPYVKIGNNVVLWSGNHIGHHSVIKDNCFISSHVTIAGFSEVGENCFLGINSSVSNNVIIAKDNWIEPNCVIKKNTNAGSLYRSLESKLATVDTYRFFRV